MSNLKNIIVIVKTLNISSVLVQTLLTVFVIEKLYTTHYTPNGMQYNCLLNKLPTDRSSLGQLYAFLPMFTVSHMCVVKIYSPLTFLILLLCTYDVTFTISSGRPLPTVKQ